MNSQKVSCLYTLDEALEYSRVGSRIFESVLQVSTMSKAGLVRYRIVKDDSRQDQTKPDKCSVFVCDVDRYSRLLQTRRAHASSPSSALVSTRTSMSLRGSGRSSQTLLSSMPRHVPKVSAYQLELVNLIYHTNKKCYFIGLIFIFQKREPQLQCAGEVARSNCNRVAASGQSRSRCILYHVSDDIYITPNLKQGKRIRKPCSRGNLR